MKTKNQLKNNIHLKNDNSKAKKNKNKQKLNKFNKKNK